MQPSAAYASCSSRSKRYAQAYQGSPASADLFRILSSMSVTLAITLTR